MNEFSTGNIFLPISYCIIALLYYSEVIHWVPIYVQGSVLGIGNLAVSKTDKNFCFDGAYILVGKTVNKSMAIFI